MVEPIPDLPDGVVGLRAVGQVTVEDYSTVVASALDGVDAASGELRLVLHLGSEFAGFGDGAWGELTSGIRQLPFYRGAVVTDDRQIRHSLRVLRWMLRGDVRTFRDHEYDEAVGWVAS